MREIWTNLNLRDPHRSNGQYRRQGVERGPRFESHCQVQSIFFKLPCSTCLNTNNLHTMSDSSWEWDRNMRERRCKVVVLQIIDFKVAPHNMPSITIMCVLSLEYIKESVVGSKKLSWKICKLFLVIKIHDSIVWCSKSARQLTDELLNVVYYLSFV